MVLYFNSIKVRLELEYSRLPLDRFNGFQFHKGAIRPIMGLLLLKLISLFQFHKGAIRTFDALPLFPSLLYFNSIKVRLELSESQGKKRVPEFQFHKGAIRTKMA